MKLFRLPLFALAALVLAAPGPAFGAFGMAPGANWNATQGQDDDEEPQKPKVDDAKAVADYEKAIKDLKRIEGSLVLYQRKKDLLLELPESKLNALFCLQASFHTGIMSEGLQAGFPAGDFIVEAYRFERHDDNVWIVRPHLMHRWNPEDPLALSAERSFPDAVLGSYRIEQKNPEKKLLLVNVSNLFNGDTIRLNEAVQGALGGPYMLDREKSSPETVRGYPDNTIVRMNLHYVSQGRSQSQSALAALLGLSGDHLEDPRSAPLKVTYNVWFRRDTGYQPRLGDPRVGFFTNDYFDLGRFTQDDRTERVIARWNLKKKDPAAAVSEPVQRVVWYVDPSVPKPYREACAEGILMWNQALDAIGFKNAIQVKFVEDGDKEWDHADGRHNVLRWAMSEDATYAITMPRIDPISGEILNASINVDANLLYAAFREKDRLVSPGMAFHQRALDVLLRNDDRDRSIPADAYLLYGEAYKAAQESRTRLSSIGWQTMDCRYAQGLASASTVAWNALEAGGKTPVSREQYAKEFLRGIVAHEAGHAMGLRHNFIASTNLTTAQLGDDALTAKKSITASLMDYTPPNIVAVLKGGRNYYASCLGDYDFWAIKYGYSDIAGASSPQAERYALSRIASQSGLVEHRFMTDEESDSFDPYVVKFDCARDPLNFSAKLLEASDRVLRYAVTQLPKNGESYGTRTQLIVSSLTRKFREGMSMARFVGGIAQNRNFKGDAGQRPTLTPVSASDQRYALKLIVSNCFSDGKIGLSSAVLNNLSMDADESFGAPASSSWQAPLRQILGSQTNALFSLLLSASTTQRIAENELKSTGSKDTYTMKEHYDTLRTAVFSEIGKGTSVSPLRRDLQRFAVNAYIVQAGAPGGAVNEDVRTLASRSLRVISQSIGASLKAKTKRDGMTLDHLKETKETIDRFLSRSVSVSR